MPIRESSWNRELNTITLKVFAPPDENDAKKSAADERTRDKGPAEGPENSTKGLTLVSIWARQVFSKMELLTRKPAPAGFKRDPFHSRERETSCAGCHNLEAPQRDAAPPKKLEDMICSVCHRKIPTGKHIHGPAAVWNCLACHNPDAEPVKYQFTSADPWKVKKTTLYDEGYRGKKNGKGFYLYLHGTRGGANPLVSAKVPKRKNNAGWIPERETVERAVFLMIKEAALCLEEKVIDRPDLLDAALIFGIGFPPFRGGLLRYADALGANYIVECLNVYAAQYGDRFSPPASLSEMSRDDLIGQIAR